MISCKLAHCLPFFTLLLFYSSEKQQLVEANYNSFQALLTLSSFIPACLACLGTTLHTCASIAEHLP
jgi:hypothetical protein